MKTVIRISFAIVLACAFALYGAYELLAPRALPGASLALTIPPGSTVRDVANILASSPLAIRPEIFELFFTFRYRFSTIKAGEYTITSPVTVPALVRILITGVPKPERSLTFIEGWSMKEISEYLERQQGVPASSFGEFTAGLFSDEFRFLKNVSPDTPLEGYLFPDTYRVFDDSDARDIARKALGNFDTQYSGLARERGKAQTRSLHEIVTIASIVEREVRDDPDRARVADIINRRLAKGMPLQMDSTINYITGKGKTRSSRDDLAIDSPYNTYKYPGLPPGPISNPGLSSLKGVLQPEANPYWYFLTTADGRVIYAKTFEEHVRNKRTYL